MEFHSIKKGILCTYHAQKKSPYDVFISDISSSALAYTPQTHAEAVDMRLTVSYPPDATSSIDQTGNVITFAQFEEGNLLSEIQHLSSETRDHKERGNKYDDDSTMLLLISEEEMYAISSGQ